MSGCDRTVYTPLRRLPWFRAPKRSDTCGSGGLRHDLDGLISLVSPGYERYGLRIGDRIVAIDGDESALEGGVGPFPRYEIERQPGTSFEVKAEREGRVVTANIVCGDGRRFVLIEMQFLRRHIGPSLRVISNQNGANSRIYRLENVGVARSS